MRLSSANLGLSLLAATFLVAETSQGRPQRNPAVTFNRPSSGASTRLGQLGGIYTRSYASRSLRAGRQQRSVARLPNSFGRVSSFGRGRRGSTGFQNRARVGAGWVQSAPMVGSGQVSSFGLAQSSGMMFATSLNRPPPPHVFTAPPRGSLLYATELNDDPFNRYYGLRESLEAENPAATRETLFDALEAGTRAHTDNLKDRAYLAFKEERYDEALNMFSGVRRLDREAYQPSLLAAHAALMLKRHALAISHLRVALERRVELFVENQSISEYFSDPTKYEDQLYELVRLPDDSPPTDLAIKSYCAWRLGDKVTARQAIERAVESSREGMDEPFILLFSRAIAPALK